MSTPPLQACPRVWHALGVRFAVAAGAGCALLALLWDAPPEAAALRGALAFVAVLTHFRLSARALGWRIRAEAVEVHRAGRRSPRADAP
jgi:hypothetical protein